MPHVTMPKSHPSTDGVSFPDGREVRPGESIEVDVALAASLIAQGWQPAEPTAAKKAAAKKKAAAPADETAPTGADTKEP